MTNLTGGYDVAVEISVAAINRVLAVLHENEDASYPVFPHSMTMFVDDTPRGPGDPVSAADRTGFQAEVEIQVSTPTLSLPQGGLVVDGVAWAARLPGPETFPQPSDVNVSAAVRAWVKGSPQPPLPEFVHGDVIIRGDIVRTNVGSVGLQHRTQAASPPPRGIGLGPALPLTPESFLGFDRTSVGVIFRPAAGTVVSNEERLRIERIVRNLFNSDMQPVTFKISLPDEVKAWDYKLDSHYAAAIVTLMLTVPTPPAGSIENVSGGRIPSGADFAIVVSRSYILDHVLSVLTAEILQHVRSSYSVSLGWGVGAEVRPDWAAAGVDLETGRIVLSVTGDGKIIYPLAPDDNFSFAVRVGFTLEVADGALELRAAGEPDVDISGLVVFEGTIEDLARGALREARDLALDAASGQIREALRVERSVEQVLRTIQPAPAEVTVTGVAIRRDGIIVSGATSLAPSTPVVVRQVKRGRVMDALDSWIPGGTIDHFRWYRNLPVLAPLILEGPGGVSSGNGVEEHQFVIEEDLLGHGHAVAAVSCLEVQGTRVTPGGVLAPISAHTCGFYHPLLPSLVTKFPERAVRPWPVLPIWGLRPNGSVGPVGHYGPWASGRAPREGPTTMVVHFAKGDWEVTAAALQDALRGLPPDTALVVVILFGERVVPELAEVRIAADVAFILGEDVDGEWADAFDVNTRPATVVVDARGRVAWREEGALTAASVAQALQDYAAKGGRVSWQPLRLAVVPGEKPPDFPFRVGRGAELSLRRLRGRRLALCFWTSWCEPSLAQLREFSRADEANNGAGPLFLAVGDGEPADVVARIADELDLPFPLIPDPERTISRRFGVGCWPSTVSIGTTMRVEAVNFGLTTIAKPASVRTTEEK